MVYSLSIRAVDSGATAEMTYMRGNRIVDRKKWTQTPRTCKLAVVCISFHVTRLRCVLWERGAAGCDRVRCHEALDVLCTSKRKSCDLQCGLAQMGLCGAVCLSMLN